MKEERPIIALSGGFDPPRKDHITLILDASKIGDVVIILNSDDWCSRHRWNNKVFAKYENRASVLSKTLAQLKPDFFGNGGSRDMTNTPEVQLCKELGIGMMWYLGDTKDEKVLQKAESYLTIAIQETYNAG